MRRLWPALRTHAGDILVVGLIIAEQVVIWTWDVGGPKAALIVIGLLWSVPLLWRKRYPLAVPLFVAGVIAIASFYVPTAVENDLGFLGGVLSAWTLGAHNDRRRAVAGYAVFYALVLLIQSNLGSFGWVDVFFITLIFTAATVAGQAVRARELRTQELRERTARLEREREARALAAVAAERARIARELHDVVAHSISVMTIQAGAARLLLDGEAPEQAEQPLLSIEETGRETLAEMRRLLGVLRRDMAADPLEARPTMANLESLVADVRAAGLPVELSVAGEAGHIAPGVDLAAYRIVQEALTNVRKHAGLVPTRVVVRFGAAGISVEVENEPGTSTAREGEPGSGHGLVGMRERVAVFGGTFDAGTSDEGGFRVRAKLPLGSSR
jgi:signal transduction histidine kinase